MSAAELRLNTPPSFAQEQELHFYKDELHVCILVTLCLCVASAGVGRNLFFAVFRRVPGVAGRGCGRLGGRRARIQWRDQQDGDRGAVDQPGWCRVADCGRGCARVRGFGRGRRARAVGGHRAPGALCLIPDALLVHVAVQCQHVRGTWLLSKVRCKSYVLLIHGMGYCICAVIYDM